MRPLAALLSILTLASLGSPGSARAQVPGIQLDLVPKIGAYVPVNDLGEIRRDTIRADIESDGSLGIGVALELGIPFFPVNVRGNLDYATGSDLSVDGDGAEMTLLGLAADLVARPLPDVLPVRPYLFLGAGLKRYDFDIAAVADDLGDALGEDETDFTLHVGAGADVEFGPVAILAEVGDYISWLRLDSPTGSFKNEVQNDVFIMIGARVGML